MSIIYKQQLNRHILHLAIFVMLICYLPHLLTAPLWLNLLAVGTLVYRFIISYTNYHRLSWPIRWLIILLCLILIRLEYHSLWSNQLYVSFFLTFIFLKLLEVKTIRDIRIICLVNFYTIFSALILNVSLWIFIYLIIAVSLNLTLMLKIDNPNARLKLVGFKTLKYIILAIPTTIILFYMFPRLGEPLWHVPLPNKNKIGFSEKVSPGAFTELFSDDSLVMRVTFRNNSIKSSYWRGLVLSNFNGYSWSYRSQNTMHFKPLKLLKTEQSYDYEVLLEPNISKWLFYSLTPNASNNDMKYLSSAGLLLQNGRKPRHQLSYKISIANHRHTSISKESFIINTSLPEYTNLELINWAKLNFKRVDNDLAKFIDLIKNKIRSENYWYRLNPASTSDSYNKMAYFWLNSKEGYCEYYASAVAIILRAINVPARVVVGYQGGDWNPVANYLTIKQNNAHAWLEYWEKSKGWHRFDPTFYISPNRIDKAIQNWRSEQYADSQGFIYGQGLAGLSIFKKLQYYLESGQYFAERWLLYYNKETQHSLLSYLNFSNVNGFSLIKLSLIVLLLFIIILSVRYFISGKKSQDKLYNEYKSIKSLLEKLNISTNESISFCEYMRITATKYPTKSAMFLTFIQKYQSLRLNQNAKTTNYDQTLALFIEVKTELKKLMKSTKKSSFNNAI